MEPMKRKRRRQQATLQRPQVTAPAPEPASNAAAVEAALAAAIQHLQSGQLQHAEAAFRRVLKAQPSHPVALHLLGAVALQAGKNETAVDLIGKAIAVKPDYAEAHNNLGSELVNQDKLAEAVACYRKAIDLNRVRLFARCHLP